MIITTDGKRSEPLVRIEKEKCKVCYACVRVCPVKAIQVTDKRDEPVILHNRCIGCGSCVSACAPSAITYRSAIADTIEILEGETKAVAIVAPSISGEFTDITDYRKFVQMIRQLGFDYVNTVSFGVDLVAAEHKRIFSDYKGKFYITANCPAVVSFVEKYYPEQIDNLMPVVSPMVATAGVVRKKYGNSIKVVYIGPCIASKDEALLYQNGNRIDAVLTFKELRELFQRQNINETQLEYSEFDSPLGYKGSLYPIENGIIQAADINEDLLTGKLITASGKMDVTEALKEFSQYSARIRCNFNLFYCSGCIMGPGTSGERNQFLRHAVVVKYASKRLQKFEKKAWEEATLDFAEVPLERTFRADDQRLPKPSKKKVQEILKSIGREDVNEILGCSACGYESCGDFAETIAAGIATPEMCSTFALQNKQANILELKKTNEELAKTQRALEISEEKARLEKEAASEASEITHTMLQKLRAGVVIVDANLKIILSNQKFIEILGAEATEINEVIPGLEGADVKTLLPFSVYNLFNYVIHTDNEIISRDVTYEENKINISVFSIQKNKVAGAVLRDLDLPHVQRDETIKRVTEVIDKNLEMVQKIGFLLGEGASETEKMLNSIIASYQNNQGNAKK